MNSIPTLIARSRPASVVMTVQPDPGATAVTLDEAKLHCRIAGDDENALLMGLILAATEYAQAYQWSQLCTATFVQRQDFFPASISPIVLARNPNPVVTSIQYIDTGGVIQTLPSANYVVDPYIVPALIVPAYTMYWPTTRWHVNDVTVTYTAGYGTAAQVPAQIKQALLLLIAHWYWNREATGTAVGNIDFAVKALLDLNSYRTFY